MKVLENGQSRMIELDVANSRDLHEALWVFF